ncbi:MAG: ScpA family protein [Pseudomonadales bacterium]|nr:ScpA family protein [Pseudomonadales bacterium]
MTDNSAETLASTEASGLEASGESVIALKTNSQVSRPRLLELRGRAPTKPSADEDAQQELPFAIVRGEELTEVPVDLYIPPKALEVFLDAFEGPLDLLLYLIKKQNLDILDINVAELTEQYMHYVRLMDTMQFELAAEYLVMAAMLAEIKSRMLLPRSQEIDDDEEDPRAQLIRRLQEYERFKKAAEDIAVMPRVERDIFIAEIEPPEDERERPQPDVDLKELLIALGDVLHRADMFESHKVHLEPLSTRERMGRVLDQLHGGEGFVSFAAFFTASEGRAGVVVTFLAIMELIKESLIDIVQAEPFAPIHIRAKVAGAEEGQ